MAAIQRISHRLHDPAVRALLALAMGNPTPETIERLCRWYAAVESRTLIGYLDGETMLGCLGYEVTGLARATVTHLAVDAAHRRQGIGRALIAHLINGLSFASLELETDRDALPFYERCGFTTLSIGEKYPGVERFRCVLTTGAAC